jgi:predicted phosphate transport protein (TIGR00153 family)
MDLLLRKTKELEMQIDEYLDLVVSGSLLFREGLKYYLRGETGPFEERMKRLDEIEGKADTLRRSIETRLYLETLIPEFRGDVLGLLEHSDKVLNLTAETLAQFSVELPDIGEEYRQSFIDLSEASMSAVESMVMAVRAYFREVEKVRDCIAKVMFYEKESDNIGDRTKRLIFRSNLKLSHKIHLRYFSYHIELIADEAEDVCDRLAIASIKRHL